MAEWVKDYYSPKFVGSSGSNPEGPTFGDVYVIRGCGWRSHASECRPAARRGAVAEVADDDVGFRLVRYPKPENSLVGQES